MKNLKLPILTQSVFFIILLGITPLLYNKDPEIFHLYKLRNIYASIGIIFLVSIFTFRYFKNQYKLSFKVFKTERILILIMGFFLFCSLFQNMSEMKLYAYNGYVPLGLFYGAGPNNLSIAFYFVSMLFLLSAIPSVKNVYHKWINIGIMISLVTVGMIIIYQIFVNNFMEHGRLYLFGFGNSNYLPDPFAIVGLLLLIPLLFNKKINLVSSLVGVFFFGIVLLSLSRAAFIGLFISLLVVLIYLIVSKKIILKRSILLFLVAIITLTGVVYYLNSIGQAALLNDFKSFLKVFTGDKTLSGISSMRTDVWKAAIDLTFANPLTTIFGNGQSVFIMEEAGKTYLATNVHNQYIDVLLSGGIVVFGIFVFLLVKQMIYAFKIVKYDINNISLLAALVFIYVKWFFNSLNALHSPFILIVFVLISSRYMNMLKETNQV
ncbi:O-antigen ligase family protein [Mycoplasmatota bacterium]|nr:O-antigen ligase family protein [Mycoplasmatota bacterium]